MSAEYQTGPAEKPDNIKITYVEERNGGYLEVFVGGEAMGVPLTLPELEGLYLAIGDVWRIAKVANKQLGKVQTDLEDLI